MSERAVPFHCPYCGDQNLWPHEATHGAWECRDCQRVFSLKSLGILRPGGVQGTPHDVPRLPRFAPPSDNAVGTPTA